jgi:hypothetical protein
MYNPQDVEQQTYSRGLIRSRLIAEVAVLLTAFVAALSVRAAFRHPKYDSEWGFPLASLLPDWAGSLVNLAFYAYLLWLFVAFFRSSDGKERIVVAGWSLNILLSPAQHLVSASVAAVIQYVKAASLVVAFITALLILLHTLAHDKALPDSRAGE